MQDRYGSDVLAAGGPPSAGCRRGRRRARPGRRVRGFGLVRCDRRLGQDVAGLGGRAWRTAAAPCGLFPAEPCRIPARGPDRHTDPPGQRGRQPRRRPTRTASGSIAAPPERRPRRSGQPDLGRGPPRRRAGGEGLGSGPARGRGGGRAARRDRRSDRLGECLRAGPAAAGRRARGSPGRPARKETRIADEVERRWAPHVRVLGHPFVDIWQAVRPEVLGVSAWPVIPRGTPGRPVCAPRSAGRPTSRPRGGGSSGSVRSYADLEPEVLGRVEEAIDLVTDIAARAGGGPVPPRRSLRHRAVHHHDRAGWQDRDRHAGAGRRGGVARAGASGCPWS